MKNWIRNLAAGLLVAMLAVAPCRAFFLGSDKYTEKEYAEASIIWKHNTICLDEYYFVNCCGQHISINQSFAEKLVTLYYNSFKMNNCDGTKDEIMYGGYLAAAQFAIKLVDEVTQETNRWKANYNAAQSANSSLSGENACLRSENLNLSSENRRLHDILYMHGICPGCPLC